MDLSVNATLAYDIPGVDGLVAKVAGVYDWSNSYNKNLNTPYSTMAFVDGAYSKKNDPRGVDNGINLGEGTSYWQQMVGQASLEYSNTFGKHSVEALALMEIRDTKSNSLAAYVKDLPFASLPEISQGNPTKNPCSGSSGASRSVGGVFRLKYNFADGTSSNFRDARTARTSSAEWTSTAGASSLQHPSRGESPMRIS